MMVDLQRVLYCVKIYTHFLARKWNCILTGNKVAYYNIRKKRLKGKAMARTKKTDILSEYERVRQPDADKLAELVGRAKGKRTTTEFAEACGVNASTISRILNKKLSGPCSDELIVAIAVNAAPGSKVRFRDLLDAHGLEEKKGSITQTFTISKLDMEQYLDTMDRIRLMQKVAMLGVARDDSEDIRSTSGYGSVVERNAAEIIQLSILNLGGTVTVKKGVDAIEGFMFPYSPDFVIETNVLSADGLDKWSFDIVMSTGMDANRHFDRLFASAYLDAPAQKGYRMTLATFNPDTFYRYLEMMRLRTVRDSISIMLLNSMTRKIDYEYVMDREGVEHQTRLFPDGALIDPQEIYGVPAEGGEE